jgi:copper chaperone CopZ|eukprot:GDKJ01045878.1.p1 GENE.GDKJ01045878.1~~GDKJ01045878.1.p1  ORF type:complete len:119 (-),score=6.58 GDKJ01045878.1:134-490(-)
MKQIIIILSIIFFAVGVTAQDGKEVKDIVTKTYKVDGTCGMCKKRIEEAAFVKGVKKTDWNKETHILTVVYKPSKTNDEAILKSVAKAGHSSELVKATDADYNKLPECCQYKTNTCEH